MESSEVITPLITPFKDQRIDFEGLEFNIRYQVQNKIDSILILGTTGEASLIGEPDRSKIIACATRSSSVPVMVNIGNYTIHATINHAIQAHDLGASSVLLMPPPYICPSDDGLINYFSSVADKSMLPVILYNHPKRTGVELSFELVKKMAQHPKIIGIKDCSNSLLFAAQIITNMKGFKYYAGDDLLSLPLKAIGSNGVFSVLANCIPGKIVSLIRNHSQEIYQQLIPLMQLSCIETNPSPIKAMMNLLGLPAGIPIPPLSPLSSKHLATFKKTLSNFI